MPPLSKKGEFNSVACESDLIISWMISDFVLIICIVLPFVIQVKQKLSAMKEELDNTDGVSRQIYFQYTIYLS